MKIRYFFYKVKACCFNILKVKNDNIQAQDYNKLLGFQEKRKLTNDFSQWSLEKDNYELKMPFLKRRMD